jgi:ATPase subunit of ABC transporter with duplicated ATPase domains
MLVYMIMDVKRSNDVKRWDGQDWEGWKQQRSQRRKQEQAQGRKQQQAQGRKSRMISSQGKQNARPTTREEDGTGVLLTCLLAAAAKRLSAEMFILLNAMLLMS